MKALVLFSRLAASAVKLLVYAVAYGRRIKFSEPFQIFIGPQSSIDLTKGKGTIEFKGRAVLRRNVILKSSGGILRVGNRFFANSGSSISCNLSIQIGAGVLLGENVHIYDHDHVYGGDQLVSENGLVGKEVIIGDNVWIGTNAVILKGTKIGSDCVIGAGAVVRGEIPAGSMVVSTNGINVQPILGSNMDKGIFIKSH
jgi:acetyltransferase-like isoleucine patch superfamily enzyme